MKRVVIDTSVFINSLIRGLEQSQLIRQWKEGHFQLIISETLLEELQEVITRPKFHDVFDKQDIRELGELILESVEVVSPQVRIEDCRDAKDNIILECALEGKAEFIITWDDDLLILNPYRGIIILTPEEFLKLG